MMKDMRDSFLDFPAAAVVPDADEVKAINMSTGLVGGISTNAESLSDHPYCGATSAHGHTGNSLHDVSIDHRSTTTKWGQRYFKLGASYPQ